MKRRQILPSAVGAVGMSTLSRAQAPRPPGKIGFLQTRPITANSATIPMLRAAWQRLGFVEGETVLLRSGAGDPRRVPQLVAELIALKVGVLIVAGGEAVRLAAQVTKKTPIVAIDLEIDPVRSGLARSRAKPGGNVTGLFMDQPSLAGKWIGLLREAAPTIERLALLRNPGTGRDQLESRHTAARAERLQTEVIEYGIATNFDDALRGLVNKRPTGIVVLTSPNVRQSIFAPTAQKYRLAAIAFQANGFHADVLMGYGPKREDFFPRAVILAAKILKGEKPADLPIKGPDRFDLVINLKTAKALGLTVPQSVRLRADQVIQ